MANRHSVTWMLATGALVSVLAAGGCGGCGSTTPPGSETEGDGGTGLTNPDGSVLVGSSSGASGVSTSQEVSSGSGASSSGGSSGGTSGTATSEPPPSSGASSGTATSEPPPSSGASSGTATSGTATSEPPPSSGVPSTSTATSQGVSSGVPPSSGPGVSSSAGTASSGPQDEPPTITFTAPANDGSTVTAPLLVDANLTFSATVADDAPILAPGLRWTVTSPSASVTNPGSLTGTTATLAVLFGEPGSWVVELTYDDGVNGPVTASLVAMVYTDLPPELAWIAPANDGTTVTGLHHTGTTLTFQARLLDDKNLNPLNITWTHTHPGGAETTSQGTYTPRAPNQATLAYGADLDLDGLHNVMVTYDDGTNARSLALDVWAYSDFPPTLTFTAPTNDGTDVTVPVASGDNVSFVVRLNDDNNILANGGAFTVTRPDGTSTESPGVFLGAGRQGTDTLAVAFGVQGTWVVSYTYTDAGPNAVTATLYVSVQQDPAPAVVITAPANNGLTVTATIREATGVTFTGTVTDNHAIQPMSLQWSFTTASGTTSTNQGVISGSGNAVTTTWQLASVGPAGTAQVSLRYTDSGANTTIAELTVPVISASAPSVDITSPANDDTQLLDQVKVDVLVNFTATVMDDATVLAAGLLWTVLSPGGDVTSSPGGYTAGTPGTQGTASLAALFTAEGTWTVSLTYTDVGGLTATETLLVDVVGNQPPTCAWVPPDACYAEGDTTLRLTLDDPDGNFPVTGQVTSSVAGDVVQDTPTVPGRSTVNVTITLSGQGDHVLTCTPRDLLGLAGIPVSVTITIPAPPTVEFRSPLDGTLVRQGSALAFGVTTTVSASAEPLTTSVYDTVEGAQAVANGAGSVAAPRLGLHDLWAHAVDQCGGEDWAGPVRYAVTPTGANKTELGVTPPLTVAGLNVNALARDGNFVLVGSTTGLYRLNSGVDPWTAAAYQPNDDTTSGVDLPADANVSAVSVGGTASNTRLEAYGTWDRGVWLCARSNGSGTCTRRYADAANRLSSNNVRAVLAVGSGANNSRLVVATDQAIHVFAIMGGVLTQLTTIDVGTTNSQVLGTPQSLTNVSAGQELSFWVATTEGATLVTIPQVGMTTFNRLDSRRTEGLFPSYDVRGVVVDPNQATRQWFATAGGLTVHAGNTYPPTSFTTITGGVGGPVGTNLTAITAYTSGGLGTGWPVLLVGTSDRGLMRVVPHQEPLLYLVTPVSTADGIGMPRDHVKALTTGASAMSAGPAPKLVGTPGGLWAYLGE